MNKRDRADAARAAERITALEAELEELRATRDAARDGWAAEAEAAALRAHELATATERIDQLQSALHALERSLLPDALLPLPGLQLASRYLPAKGMHDVGGDFFDAIRESDQAITLIVGDVQGKGVEAATLTSLARHTLRAGALAGRSPVELLDDLNAALLYGQAEQLQAGRDPVLRFVTAVVARLEVAPDGFVARVARAGQPPPIVVRSAGQYESVEPAGVLLGVTERPHFDEATVTLGEGDTIVLYTDGVIEHRSATPAFSEQHLGMLVRNRREVLDAEATAQLIEDTVHLVAPEDVRDDVAILVACVLPRRATRSLIDLREDAAEGLAPQRPGRP